MIVSVIGGGWSFREVDHAKVPGVIIGVNDALIGFKGTLNHIVSMDRIWAEKRWDELQRRELPTHLRRSTLKNVPWKDKPWGWLHPFENENDGRPFTMDHRYLEGRSSGACAIALAYKQRPTTVYLFGFDMCLSPDGDAHWYDPYPWVKKGRKGGTGAGTYADWVKDFETYAEQFRIIKTRVVNVSEASLITSFDRVSAKALGIAA